MRSGERRGEGQAGGGVGWAEWAGGRKVGVSA